MNTSTLGSAVADRCSYAPATECRPRKIDESSAQTEALRYRRTERTALYIETQEGDVVRIRIKVRDAVNATASSGTDGAGTELTVAAHSSTKIRLSVEGDLNAEELAAIRGVIEQASSLADEFFAGDLPKAFTAAQAFEIDADTLARVGLRLSVREHLTYSATGAHTPLPAAREPSEPAAPAIAPPVIEPPAESAPAVNPPVAVTGATASEDPAPTEAAPTDPTPTLPAQSVASQTLTTIATFIAALLDSLAPPADGAGGDAVASLDMSVRLRIVRALVVNLAAQDASPAAAGGVELAADTFDALAAQRQSLDAHA